jgi:hypothetical protein
MSRSTATVIDRPVALGRAPQAYLNGDIQRAAEAAQKGIPTAEVVDVSPQMADQWLAMSQYEHQRQLREDWVLELANYLLSGEWETTMMKFRVDMQTGQWSLVDGQHRLNAISLAGISAPLTVMWEPARVAEDIHASYRRIDTGLQRRLTERLATEDLEDRLGLRVREVKGAASAVAVLVDGFQSTRVGRGRSGQSVGFKSAEMRIRGIERWGSEAAQYFPCVRPAQRSIGHRMELAAIAAVGFVTFRYEPEKAQEFWSQVATGDMLPSDSPALKLREYLLGPDSRRTATGGRISDMARLAATCWNHHYRGRRLSLLRVYGSVMSRPILIEGRGCPYNGRDVITDLDQEYSKYDATLTERMARRKEARA